MTAENPRVSICVPAFKREKMLLECIASVRNQSYPDWELIIVHDGENRPIREAVEQIPDPRIRFFENPVPLGVPKNWNKCLGLARGEWVQILPDDDALLPDFLRRSVAAFSAEPNVGFVQAGGFNCDEQLKPVRAFTIAAMAGTHRGVKALDWQFKTLHCMPATLLFKKSVLLEMGFWRDDYHDDWATILKVAFRFGFHYIDVELCGVRAHSQNYAKRLGREGRDGIGDLLNQTVDIFGDCMPFDLELLALQQRCLREIGSRSAKASLKALALGRLQKAVREARRAWLLNPWAYLGPGIYRTWRDAKGSRELVQMLKKSRRLSERIVYEMA